MIVGHSKGPDRDPVKITSHIAVRGLHQRQFGIGIGIAIAVGFDIDCDCYPDSKESGLAELLQAARSLTVTLAKPQEIPDAEY